MSSFHITDFKGWLLFFFILILSTKGCSCGEIPVDPTREGRIVCPKGETNCGAKIGDVPWQAGLAFNGKFQPWCGGTLISDQYVLTAAHCIKGRSTPPFTYQIILGENNWRTRQEAQETRHSIIKAMIHPRFEEKAPFDFDFALLKLAKPIDFTQHSIIRPACLPPTTESSHLNGKSGIASGWGVVNPNIPSRQANTLQKVTVKILADNECKYKYPTYPSIITPSMFCASADSADACYGDSGGPFTVHQGNVSVLEGVISWGKSCAKTKWPGVYARVRYVLDWISNNIQDSNQCKRRDTNSGEESVLLQETTLSTTTSATVGTTAVNKQTLNSTIRPTQPIPDTFTTTTERPSSGNR